MKSQYVVSTLMAIMLSGCVVGTVSSPTPNLGVANAEERDVEDVGIFYDALAPHGTWVVTAEYNRVWRPRGISRDWRPYTHGRWVYTDDGWTWLSDWEWGWAPFHYGRWYSDVSYGWVWVPGTVWAPSWVAWHHGTDWVGWAPLPPTAGWRPHAGISIDIHLDPGWFSFVHPRYLLEPHVYRHAAPVRQNVQLVQVTRNVTNYTIVNNRIVNYSIRVNDIERATRRPVRRLHVVETDSVRIGGGGRLREREGQVALYRPRVGRGSLDEELARPYDRRSRARSEEERRGSRSEQHQDRPGREQRHAPPEVSGPERRPGQDTVRDEERRRSRQERQERRQNVQEPRHPGARTGVPARQRLQASPEDDRSNRRQNRAKPAPGRDDEQQNRRRHDAQSPDTTRQNPDAIGSSRSEPRATTRAERQEQNRSRRRQRANDDEERPQPDQEDKQPSVPSARPQP